MTNYSSPIEPVIRHHIVTLGRTLAAHQGVNIATVARRVLGGNTRLFSSIETGEASITLRNYDRLMTELSTIWPSDLPWPDGVPRYAPDHEMLAEKNRIREIKAAARAAA